jgi:hypothetical protein
VAARHSESLERIAQGSDLPENGSGAEVRIVDSRGIDIFKSTYATVALRLTKRSHEIDPVRDQCDIAIRVFHELVVDITTPHGKSGI